MVTGIGEELDNVIAATEFTTEIKAYIAIRRRRRKAIQSKPGVEKLKRRSLGSEALTKKHTTKMVD
jgi:hypothetical protein